MKARFGFRVLAAGLLLGTATSFGASFYIDDGSDTGDIWTPSQTGNDSNSGTTTNAPKRSLASLFASTNLQPGDVVYIDTGTYATNVVISNTVSGTAGNRIVFQGSTNLFAGGATFISSANKTFEIKGRYLEFRNIRVQGGFFGLYLDQASHCDFEGVYAVSNSYSLYTVSSSTNSFRRSVFRALAGEAVAILSPGRGNNLENCIALAPAGWALAANSNAVTNFIGCVAIGRWCVGNNANTPDAGSRNVFFSTNAIHPDFDTLAGFQAAYTNWRGNVFADPAFLNMEALDFHLLSPAGMVSNGVWVTNAALPFSPAIDFGRLGDLAYTNEFEPNGTRVNVGLYGGTAEASKSRTNAWLYAMSFNDGGSLIQTARLEWAAGNFATGATVNVQFSTNSGATWSNIAAGVAVTNESQAWVPSPVHQHPAALWRVVSSTNSAIASTNAKPFSIRPATNSTFNFYVNDASTNNDLYCTAVGSATNLGIASNAPLPSLQAVLDAYDLEGGDTVYIDTGTYLTNFTTTIGFYDSGRPGLPVRIQGSPRGSILNRGSTSADTLALSSVSYGGVWSASYIDLEDLELRGGRYGASLASVSNVNLRNVRMIANQWGLYVDGSANQNRFEGCLAADNTVGGVFSASGVRTNLWMNGTIWGNPTALSAQTNSLSVSNSILGNATTLFGSQVVPGDFNLVWGTGIGATYATLTALQNAGSWTRSLAADPLFANAAGGDYHVKSLMGRYNPATGSFETNDTVHSPAIDLGDPAAAYANEPTNNGGRLNVGMFGNTAQASKSRTNAWLQVLSYTDGGTLDAKLGTTLRWTGSAFSPTNKVTIWLSRDDGGSWEILATNIAATNGFYPYQNTSPSDASALFARWRITLEGYVPEVGSQTQTNFNYKSGPYIYYVNDNSRSNDVWCSAVGNDSNLGVSTGAPMASLAALVARYPLGPGDRVYVDTGSYYYPSAPVILAAQHAGVATNPVVIIGSPNRLAGGSRFGSPASPMGLGFDIRLGASNLILQDIVITNVNRGVTISNAANITLDGIEVRQAGDRAFEITGGARGIQLLRSVAHGGGTGVALERATNVTVRNCVFWQHSTYATWLGTGLSGGVLENSILGSTNNNALLVSYATTNGTALDYNGLYTGPFSRVGENRISGGRAENLAAWQALSGGDAHSLPGDPLMADPGQYDYHLKTEQTLGRVTPDGQRSSDPVSSPLLDAGNPATTSWTNEPAPNGGRINIGRYGGTAEASIAVPSPWLRTVSFGDQGFVTNGTVPLRWTAGGGFSNETVKVEVSVDGGKTWGTLVATGVPATNEMVNWTVTGLPDTPAATWRVSCLERTNVTAQAGAFFAIRNSPLLLYLATADTNETIYVSGPGAPDNWMATAGAPLNSLATAFDRFDLEPGDQIRVDTGVYIEPNPVVIGPKDAGLSNAPVRITGNTNLPFQATVLARPLRTEGSDVLQLLHTRGLVVRAMFLSNAWNCVYAENSQAIQLEQLHLGYCVTNALFASFGAQVELTRSLVEQSLSAGIQAYTGSVLKVYNGLLRDNALANVAVRGGEAEVKSSILEAVGSQRFVYYLGGSVSKLAADFNNVRVSEGAHVAGGPDRNADRFLIDWQISTAFSNDVSSFGYDPLFANTAEQDFHLQSQWGRWVPGAPGYWTNDPASSLLIDLGDPAAAYANEPATNGGRINVGLFGNTGEASKSSGQGSLVPLTMSDGGTIRGQAKLYWSFNGLASNALVNVDFSADGGSSWTSIAVNAYADAGRSGQPWNTTNYPSTAQGVWRVCTTNGVTCGQTIIPFAVKNDPLSYYVNDNSTNGDVYCTAAGLAAQSGLSSNAPIDSIERLLNKYKVDPGDTIYVDTGIYGRSSPLVFSIPSPGATNWLVVQGSTNEAAGGSVFTNASGAVLEFQNTRRVELRDLHLLGGSAGLVLSESSSNRFLRVRSLNTRGNAFVLGQRSDQNHFIQCAALNFFQTGFHVVTPINDTIAPATNFWNAGVMASVAADSNGIPVSTGILMGVRSGRIYVSNSVFVAGGGGHAVLSVGPGTFQGDYNCYHRPYGASVLAKVPSGNLYGVAEVILEDLGAWRQWSLADSNSIAADPRFADLNGGDLHPRSQGGRYVPVQAGFTNDTDTSPLIDAADPALAWAAEQGNNGRRANLGVYGGTPFASQTPGIGTFVLLDLGQGGVAQGAVPLRWIARGGATNIGLVVDIQVSTNSGASWNTIGTAAATGGVYNWDSTTMPTLPTARWRVRVQSETAWQTISDRDFLIRNTNLTFYINDAWPSNDVYCSASGSAANTGLRADSPLASLADLLARYNLEPGDIVKIDTGEYALEAPVSIGFLDSGSAASPVQILGSTNYPGTRFTGFGFQLADLRGVVLRDLQFSLTSPSLAGLTLTRAEDSILERVDVRGGSAGYSVQFCSNVVLRNFLAANAVTNGVVCAASWNTCLEFGTVWSNKRAQIRVQNDPLGSAGPLYSNSFLTVSNCALGTFGNRNPIYEVRGNLQADYNSIYLGSSAYVAMQYDAGGGVEEFNSVQRWATDTGRDVHSLSKMPSFADTWAGDFHLKSSAGRWDPASTNWVLDPAAENSPLIDAGTPGILPNETPPNGGRVNIGRFGHTLQASRTPTNSALTLISFNDGGRAVGTAVPIRWNARGAITGGTVSIYYSADGGLNWTLLTNGLAAQAGYWEWNSTLSQQSVEAKLKIVGNDGAEDQSDKLFPVRNAPITYYVNDGSTNQDVYCAGAVGNNANSGVTNTAPMADLNALLDKYDLEGGDIVLIDTGTYSGPAPWRIYQVDSAGNLEDAPVVIQGSTNRLGGGTVLERSFNPVGIEMVNAVGVELRNITISNTVEAAVSYTDCQGVEAEWLVVGSANAGFQLTGGTRIRIAHCALYDLQKGIMLGARDNNITNMVYPVFEHNVVLDAAESAIQINGNNRMTVKHNILSVAPGQYIYRLAQTDALTADYNAIWLGSGSRMFRREAGIIPVIYETVGAWAAASGEDLHSYDGNPLFANAAARDFHLKSTAGRLLPSGAWTNDNVTSPLIDAGWPYSMAWTNEPGPNNGSRVNIGLYGGSPWASQSATNSALYLLSLNRGGVATGQVVLSWQPAGRATGHTVKVEVSINDGADWTQVAQGISASWGGITWNSLSLPSSPLARWRVQDEQESGVAAASELPFVLHNSPLAYYVNDSSTTGDVYCANAIGVSTNTGTSALSPKRTVADIIETYNLEPGDVVYVDTGVYLSGAPTVIGDLDAGAASQNPAEQVTLAGSTNPLAGGSQFIMSTPDASMFHLDDTHGLRFQQLNISGALDGILADQCYYLAADGINVTGCSNGLRSMTSSNIVITRSVFAGNRNAGIHFYGPGSDTMQMDTSVLWSNRYGIYLQYGYVHVTNSIIGMVAPGSFGIYRLLDGPPSAVRSDYNSLYVGPAGRGIAAYQTGFDSGARTTVYATVSTWTGASGQDAHSLAHEPKLADPGHGDYHLQSTSGRRRPDGNWTNDPVTSPLIDAGNPQSINWTLEPDPNGRRLNIGPHGGTGEASKSPSGGTITLVSLNDGGSAAGTVPLLWTARGAATNFSLCIEYSPDDGVTWTNIVCGWPAILGRYDWDSIPYGRSALGRWRAFCLEDPAVLSVNLMPFVLRNGGRINYYVNDTSTNGDVYCTVPGNDNFNGLSSNTPKASLQAVLDAYLLEPEDVVLVDAGIYSAGAPPITINQSDSGWSNLYVTIQGSTNPVAPTVFQSPSFFAPYVISLEYAQNVRLRNLTVRNAQIGVNCLRTIGCELDRVQIDNNRQVGLNLFKDVDFRLVRSVLWNNNSFTSGYAVVNSDSRLTVENCVLWESPSSIRIEQGSLTVVNSALKADGPQSRVFVFSPSASAVNGFQGDFNSYSLKNGALICEQQKPSGSGGNDFYGDLIAWNAAVSNDAHSMQADPFFADEVGGDFHLRSAYGRWTAAGWTNDPATNLPPISALVDAGDPGWPFDLEGAPNGGVINIGAYGNTEQASLSQTNPPWVRVVSYNSPGIVSGNSMLLYWVYGGMASNSWVRLEYSTDYAVTWKPIASNFPVGTREFDWNVSALPLTRVLNWRVTLQSNTNITDVSDEPVSRRIGAYDYYVNDASTNGDVWCSAPGMPWDQIILFGTNSATPIDSVQAVFSNYPIGPGDRIFVDTGVYSVTNPIRISGRNSGEPGLPLQVIGSTNFAAGGTRLEGYFMANGIEVQNARDIELQNLRISDAQNGVYLRNAAGIQLAGLDVFRCASNGLSLVECGDLQVSHSRLWGNARYGYSMSAHQGAAGINQSTIWGNKLGGMYNDKGGMQVSNSILGVTNQTPIYVESGTAAFGGDYNLFELVPGSVIGTNQPGKTAYLNLSQWQIPDRDTHSLVAPAWFAQPGTGDFHLLSRAGYLSNGVWRTADRTSWGIDAGDPLAAAWTNELPSNGNRINLGAHGGTPEASLSDSSVPELFAVSLRDGGVATNGQPLHWLYRGINATNFLKIEYSPDGGASWILVVTNLPAGSSPYPWVTTVDPTPEARWRITLMSNPSVYSETPTNFTLRTRGLTYYVNDISTNGDVYCQGPGIATNRGYVSNSPLHSIQAVLNRYQLIGGDEIKVDTGAYVLTNSVFLGVLTSGSVSNRVKVTGSTNRLAGGTWFQAGPGMQDPAFEVLGAGELDLAFFKITGFTNGVAFIENAANCTLAECDMQGSLGPAVMVNKATGIRLERVLIREGHTNAVIGDLSKLAVDSCVFWSNRYAALRVERSDLFVSNSVIGAYGEGNFCYQLGTNVIFMANYNNLFVQNKAQIGSVEGLAYDKLPQWVKGTYYDRYSLSTPPLFYNPGLGDFHVRSIAGRYQPGSGFVLDVSTNTLPNFSPMIDLAAPKAAWSNEESPNGSRRNIGLYGNTREASKSNTNRWLLAITAMSGGIVQGSTPLVWGYGGGIPSNEIVQLEYSYDNGQSWIYIGEETVGRGEISWDSARTQAGIEIWPSSPGAWWRVFLQSDTNVWSKAGPFGLRNSPFKYYLNDTSRVNDVYTGAIGSDTNPGYYAAAPKLTLGSLLEDSDFEPGDIVYVDTGVYWMMDTNRPMLWDSSDGGSNGMPVLTWGSSHPDGSVFIASARFVAGYFLSMLADHVSINNLAFNGESVRLVGNGLTGTNLWISNGTFSVTGSSNVFSRIRVDRGGVALSGMNLLLTRLEQRWGEVSITGTNIVLMQSAVLSTNAGASGILVDAVAPVISNVTVVATRGTALRKRGPGTLRLGHSILVAGGGEEHAALAWEDGGLFSDWNNLRVANASWIGFRHGRWEKLSYWQAASGQDANSVSFDPLFQNEPAGDFHLNSTAGRWSPIFNDWDYGDTTNSPLIDLGDPWIGTGEEVMYNGYRRNLGAYGGTEQASRSRTNFWLTALTQNDGGVLKGSNVVLRWASGNTVGQTVTLQYFDGMIWTTIVSGVDAALGAYPWNSLMFPDSFAARWRVVSDSDPNVWDQTDQVFQLRNQPKAFYVNDGSQAGDVFCGAIGLIGNDGLSTNTPMAALQQILDAYDLEGGDTIYVDSGTYVAPTNVRMIWSRSGTTNADVVIQGNPQGPLTLLTRSGNTNFPAIGLDVKASHVQFNHLVILGPDRGMLLESNQSVSVRGNLFRQSRLGLDIVGAQDTQVSNSGFLGANYGISLFNTATSRLVNLTFAQVVQAGIRLTNTTRDILQNNIFIPLPGGYAYSIGASTTVLQNAEMDYNLYDFSAEGSWFYAGATNDLRRWHLTISNDFRSAITNADLADPETDLHPKSAYGRWTGAGWTNDENTSWAVDHGRPDMDFSQEPTNNGDRINIGMYGNTDQASKGNTNVDLYCRTMNDAGLKVVPSDPNWPFIWSAHMVDADEEVLVQFSADNGASWLTLTNTSAQTEYFHWRATIDFQTLEGRWRVISATNENLVDINDEPFEVSWYDLGIIRVFTVGGLARMEWVGGKGGRRYIIRYSDDFGKNWYPWEDRFNGPDPINKSNFVIPSGGAALSYIFEDRTSYLRRTRWYRVDQYLP